MAETTDCRKRASIVIVDDELPILKELRILLGRIYNVSVFENPVEAEAFVDEHHVDMVISDEMMPEMRGSELLARIHRKHPDICNIVLSGQAEKDDIVRAVNDGHIFSFLYKPAERQQLINVIEKGLENQQMKRMLAEQNIRLKEYSENLEKMVAEKTAELIKAHDRLSALDADKMSFLIYLTEEMDSPLDRIQKLAETLLTYFAMAGSDLQTNMVPVRPGEAIDAVLRKVAGRAEKKGIAIEANVDPDLTVLADPDFIDRVLLAVIENSIEYTPAGGRVTVTGRGTSGWGVVRITDTGRGIREQDIPNIFKPFQLERSRRHPDGFGLNLPMAGMMMGAMGGRIRVESDGEGAGASFVLELRQA